MPYTLPEGFPNNLNDAELADVVRGMTESLRQRYGDEAGAWLPELQLAVLTAALSEQSRRELASGARIAKWSLIVAGLAIAVAIVSALAG